MWVEQHAITMRGIDTGVEKRSQADRNSEKPVMNVLRPEHTIPATSSSICAPAGAQFVVSVAGAGACTPDVDRGEQEQPYHVNEVPVPGGRFEAEVLLGREVALQRPDQADE